MVKRSAPGFKLSSNIHELSRELARLIAFVRVFFIWILFVFTFLLFFLNYAAILTLCLLPLLSDCSILINSWVTDCVAVLVAAVPPSWVRYYDQVAGTEHIVHLIFFRECSLSIFFNVCFQVVTILNRFVY